jgi:hypothetical protein
MGFTIEMAIVGYDVKSRKQWREVLNKAWISNVILAGVHPEFFGIAGMCRRWMGNSLPRYQPVPVTAGMNDWATTDDATECDNYT